MPRVAYCPVSGACALPVWLAAKGKREPGALACMRCNNAHASASKARTAPATVSKCGCIMRCMARVWLLAWQAVTVSYGRCANGRTDTKWEGDASKLASPDTGLKRVCWRQ